MYNISYVIVRVFSSKPMPYLFGRFLFSFFLQRLFLITNYCTTIMQVLEFWWSQHSFMLASETSLTFSSANCSNILQFCLYSISNCFVLKIFQKKTKKKNPFAMIEEKHYTDVRAGGQYPLNEVERPSLFCQMVTRIYFHII